MSYECLKMQYLFIILCISSVIHCILCLHNYSRKDTNEIDDYYSNYDYELSVNVTDEKIKTDSLILPNPEFVDSKYTIDVLPKVELPSDTLADTDLRDHDFIDNLMYIYYGSHSKNTTSLGSEIIIVGSVLSCAAQLLTIFCALLRKNSNGKKDVSKIFMHMVGSLCLTNLVFMLGVYSTKNYMKCQILALILHYLHLLTAFWIFMHCYYICKRFSGEYLPKLRYFCFLTYGVPFLLVMLSFAISPHSYETKLFCFVSVQKGMLLNYMFPVSILIIATTILALNGIRKMNLELSKLELTSSESLNALRAEDMSDSEKNRTENMTGDEEIISLREFKNSLKTLSLVQTSYDVVWFISVLALENALISNVMPILYAMSSCMLNWYIFAKSKSFVPAMHGIPEKEFIEDAEIILNEKQILNNTLQSSSRCGSSDNIPLLNSTECYTELRELRHDTISTISS